MKTEELKAIEERAAKAWRGPWACVIDTDRGPFDGRPRYEIVSRDDVQPGYSVSAVMEPEDCEFMAHARADIPALIAEVRKLRSVLESIQWGSCDGCGSLEICPICKGRREDYSAGYPYPPGKHTNDCPVGEALK